MNYVTKRHRLREITLYAKNATKPNLPKSHLEAEKCLYIKGTIYKSHKHQYTYTHNTITSIHIHTQNN